MGKKHGIFVISKCNLNKFCSFTCVGKFYDSSRSKSRLQVKS
jgi:hypothetical protein